MTAVRLVPLGGLGEIGLNCLVVEAGGERLLVDCGLLFAQDHHPGVDYLVPDLTYLDTPGRLRAVVVTHGHEDHIGGIPHLLARHRVPVYGTAMTLGLLRERLAERTPTATSLLQSVAPGAVVEAGPFRVEFIRITHSTAGACALGIEVAGRRIVHTGDFKFDPTPVDGLPTDEAALARWGDAGVDLLCCDSTNAHRPGPTPSERLVGQAFRDLLPRVEGRAWVATFASNVHRVQQVIEASRAAGRRVTLLGRAMVRTARIARSLGHLKPAPGDLVPEPRARGFPRDALTVILTGSQAEPGSALWRVTRGLEPHHRIVPGDHVFLSSRLIPGNEREIYRLIDRCIRLGARVHYEEVSEIHVSGHASAADARRMVELTRPRCVLPVHGELRHLQALTDVMREMGYGPDRAFRAENGQVIVLDDGGIRPEGTVPTGRCYVEAGAEAGEGDAALADRRRLGRAGLALVVAAVDPAGAVVWGPRVELRGVVPQERSGEEAREAEAALEALVRKEAPNAPSASDWEALFTLALRRHFRRRGNRRPVVVATVAEV
ncbi:ribonuclease J [Deferrisoma palaeochoriense]